MKGLKGIAVVGALILALFFLASCIQIAQPEETPEEGAEEAEAAAEDESETTEEEAAAEEGAEEAPAEEPAEAADEAAEESAEEGPPATGEVEFVLPPGLEDSYPKDLPRKVVKEGDLVDFPNLAASDPDGDAISYTFSEPLDANGEWQTAVGDVGVYKAMITAGDGRVEVSQDIVIIVLPRNRAPEITLASTDIMAKENEELCVDFTVSDPEGDEVSTRYKGFLTSKCITPGFGTAGDHDASIIASDGELENELRLTISVAKTNRAPSITALEPIEVNEGDTIQVVPAFNDPDNDPVVITYSDPLDDNGEWETSFGDAGGYEAHITVDDGEFTDSAVVKITVKEVNRPPAIKLIDPDLEVDEGEQVCIAYDVSDSDDDEVEVTFSGWMDAQCKVAGYADQGTYNVIVAASDGKDTSEAVVTVIVNDVNRPPTFDPASFT